MIDITREQHGYCTMVLHTGAEQPAVESVSLISVEQPLVSPIPLRVLSMRHIDLDQDREFGVWAPWVAERYSKAWRVLCELPAQRQPQMKQAQLFDLEVITRKCRLLRKGAICIRYRQSDGARIVIASDLHVARRWDALVGEAKNALSTAPSLRTAPGIGLSAFDPRRGWSGERFESAFVNPNSNVRLFIRRVNQLWDRGEILAVVMAGDLVDFKFEPPRKDHPKSLEETQMFFLQTIILGESPGSERLRAPLFVLPGNHDYRLYPYRLRTWGLGQCGVPESLAEQFFAATGELKKPRYSWHDLDALRISLSKERGNHSLDYYYDLFNPFSSFAQDFGSVHMVGIDTGPDLIPGTPGAGRFRSPLYRRAWRVLSEPMVLGATDRDMDFVEQRLASWRPSDPLLVVAHAPVMNPEAQSGSEARSMDFIMPQVGPQAGDAARRKAERAFVRGLVGQRLCRAVAARNGFRLLQLLCRRPGQTALVSGHNHAFRELAICRATGALSAGDSTWGHDSNTSHATSFLMVHAPALGLIGRECRQGDRPAYLCFGIERAGGAVISRESMVGEAVRGPASRQCSPPTLRHSS